MAMLATLTCMGQGIGHFRMRNGLRREPGPRTYNLLVDEAKILNEIFSHVQTVMSTKPFFHLRNGLGTRLTVVLKGSVCILIDSSIIVTNLGTVFDEIYESLVG